MPRLPIHILVLVMLLAAMARSESGLQIDTVTGQLRIQVESNAPATLTLGGSQILPIEWHRRGLTSARLPIIRFETSGPLTVVNQDQSTYTFAASGVLPQVKFDPNAYATVANWHGQPSPEVRRRYVGASILFSLGLLLTLLVRRRQTVLAASYCAAWMVLVCLGLASGRSPHTRDDPPITWYYAAQAQTVRIDIANGSGWIPVVESMDHLRSLNPHIDVVGERAQIVFNLKQAGVLGLRSP